MRIRLERRGLYLVVTAFLVLGVGIVASRPVVAGWGLLLLGGVALSFGRALLASLAVRRGGLTLQCEAPHGPSKVYSAGDRVVVPLRMRNALGRGFDEVRLLLARSSTLMFEGAAEQPLSLPAGGDVLALVPLRATAAGTWWVHGAHVQLSSGGALFTVQAYLPAPYELKVLPRRALPLVRAPFASTRAALRDAAGSLSSSLRGFGLDVKELREHVPGDPFKHIAWKASARRGTLIVREFESDVTLSAYLVVDTSPSMRWGSAGASRLDRALDVAYGLAHALAQHRDRVGAVLCDGGVVSFSAATAGHRALVAVIDQLLETHNVVDERLTALTDDEVIELVADFARTHAGRDYSGGTEPDPEMRPLADQVDTEALHAWVLSELRADEKRQSWLHRDVRFARDPRMSDLRLFCRLRGLELPYRSDAMAGNKEKGLVAALSRVLEAGGGPHTVVVLSDLEGVGTADTLAKRVRALRVRKHAVVFVLVREAARHASAGAAGEEMSPLAEGLRTLLALESEESLGLARMRLVQAGAKVVVPIGTGPRPG